MNRVAFSAVFALTFILMSHLTASENRCSSPEEEALLQAYVKANAELDFESVATLFDKAEIGKKQTLSEDELPSSELTYIHEPYWRYNIIQLRDYGKRIIKKISPYFVDAADVDEKNRTVFHSGETVKVRKVSEFGRALPLIYLREILERTNAKGLSVPRIFIVPTKSKKVSFTFHMPYLREEHQNMFLDVANNILQVESDSFEIYQEYIEGNGFVGDKSFSPYGHCDFNAKQIVRSTIDGKKYLIDTKESKNFFTPQLNPIQGSFFSYWHLKIGRYLPQDERAFEQWKKKQQHLMLREKALHYLVDLPSIQVDIGNLESMRLEAVSLSESIFFDDDEEDTLYFSNPKDNIARYLAMGRFDLLKKFIKENRSLSLDGILVPTFLDATTLRQLTPVQFILRQNIVSEELFELLALFKDQRQYFENPGGNTDFSFLPLRMALKWMSPELIEFMIQLGADPNDKLNNETVLDQALRLLAWEINSKNLENQKSLLIIIEILLERIGEIESGTLKGLIGLIPSESEGAVESLLTPGMGKNLLSRMLKKSKTESSEVIIEAANLGSLELLNLVLAHYVDQKVLQDALKGLLTADLKSRFKELPEELRVSLLRTVLEKIDYVDEASLDAAFKLGAKQILSDMIDKKFDTGFALRVAVQNVKDPSHDYIRAVTKDTSLRDPYWNQLVEKILTKSPSEEALDKAIVHALVNGKVEILESLLQYMPENAPHTHQQVAKIVKEKYTNDLILEKAVSMGNVPLTRLLVSADINVPITHFRQALWLRRNQHQILDILIGAKNISLGVALCDAIDAGCTEAIMKIVPKLEKISSEGYRRAFAIKNPKVIDAILSHLNHAAENKELMTLYDVEELIRSGDVSAIEMMVERNVNLGESLVAVVRLITFAADNKLKIDYNWYELLRKIVEKNPPAKDVDHALAVALINSQTLILSSLISKMPEDAPKSKWAVQRLVANQYMRGEDFRTAILLDSETLTRFFIECGMKVNPSHIQLAESLNLQKSLKVMRGF